MEKLFPMLCELRDEAFVRICPEKNQFVWFLDEGGAFSCGCPAAGGQPRAGLQPGNDTACQAFSTQGISILGEAEAGGLPPALAHGSKTSEYSSRGWRETIEKVG